MSDTTTDPIADQGGVLVLGAGLAGSFAARALAEAGWRVRVVDRQPVDEDGPVSYAPRVALLQPKINDRADKPGQWLREGAELARHMIESRWADHPRVGWRRCGAFHIAHDERSQRRLTRYLDQFGGTGGMRWIDAADTGGELGVGVRFPGLLLGSTGILRPAGLCAALLDHPRIAVEARRTVLALRRSGHHWSVQFEDQGAVDVPRVVVANAMAALTLEPTAHLGLRPVRGQVSLISKPAMHRALGLAPGASVQCALCYGGYLMPAINDAYTLGASFVPGDTGVDWRAAEHREALERFGAVFNNTPTWSTKSESMTGWTGIRCTTPTHRSIAGPVMRDGAVLPGLYASLGHGSHGIASAARSAQHIVETIV